MSLVFQNVIFSGYLCRYLACEGIVMLGVCVSVCVCLCVCRTTTARRISLSGIGIMLYPVLSSLFYYFLQIYQHY